MTRRLHTPADTVREKLEALRAERQVLVKEAHSRHLQAALHGRRASTKGLDQKIARLAVRCHALEKELFSLERWFDNPLDPVETLDAYGAYRSGKRIVRRNLD